MSLVGSEVPPGTASSDDRGGGGREIDTRSVVERALGDALREVTLKYDAIEREKNGGADLNSNSYDMAAHEALLANPEKAGGALTVVDAAGNVAEDYDKMDAFAAEVLEVALARVPEEVPSDKVKNPMAAFQAAFQARGMREQIKAKCKEEVIAKAKEEVRLLRRRFLMARELSKPKEVKPKGALIQAAFLEARDAAAKGRSVVAAKSRVSLLTQVDPYDESVFGVTNASLHLVKQNVRVTQTVLEYLLGYASVVDPTDLEEIEAGAQGLQVSRGKSLRELSLKYAQHLDKTLPERHKTVIKSMIRAAAEEQTRHANMGAEAEERYDARPYPGARDVHLTNRDAWLRKMFPDAPWPARVDALEEERRRALRDTASGPKTGALINPMDPDSGTVGGAMHLGAEASSAREVRMATAPPAALPGARGAGFGGGAGDPGTITAAGRRVAAANAPRTGTGTGTGTGTRAGMGAAGAPSWLGAGGGMSGGGPGAGTVPFAGAVMPDAAPTLGLHNPLMTGAGAGAGRGAPRQLSGDERERMLYGGY